MDGETWGFPSWYGHLPQGDELLVKFERRPSTLRSFVNMLDTPPKFGTPNLRARKFFSGAWILPIPLASMVTFEC